MSHNNEWCMENKKKEVNMVSFRNYKNIKCRIILHGSGRKSPKANHQCEEEGVVD